MEGREGGRKPGKGKGGNKMRGKKWLREGCVEEEV